MINFFRRVHWFKTGGLTWFDSFESAWVITVAMWKIKMIERHGK